MTPSCKPFMSTLGLIGFLGLSLSIGNICYAGGLFKTLPDMLDGQWRSHEIAAASLLTRSHFSLSSYDRHDIVQRHLRDRGLHPLLRLTAKPTDFERKPYGDFSPDLGLVVRDYLVRAGKFEVCKATVRTVDSPSGAAHVLGLLPNVDAVYPTSIDSWPSSEEAAIESLKAIKEEAGSSNVVLAAMSPCLYPLDGELLTAWKVTARAGAIPYVVYVGHEGLIEGQSVAFDANAKVKAYQSSSNHPVEAQRALVDFNVEVHGDGFLTNDYFTTAFDDGTPRKSAPFDATESSSRHFDEQSTFAHVNRQFQLLSQFGYVWRGAKPIKVITSSTRTDPGNALYVPFLEGEPAPLILIGADYAGKLTRLARDSDVVSHEFGHHVVFGSITDVPRGSESIVLHEGLADALTFYASGDNCLGESICPTVNDGSCYVRTKCLRTADNNLKYNDAEYASLAGASHLRGQLISGFFADLKRGGQIPSDNLNKLLIATITYLPSLADMKSFVTALLDADYALFGQQYADKLKQAASARGLGVDVLGVNLAEVDGQRPIPESSKKKGGEGFLGLCSVGGKQQSSLSGIFVMLLLSFPVFVSICRRPQRQLVKVRKIKK